MKCINNFMFKSYLYQGSINKFTLYFKHLIMLWCKLPKLLSLKKKLRNERIEPS